MKWIGMMFAVVLAVLMGWGRPAIAETVPELEVFKVDRVVMDRDFFPMEEGTLWSERPLAQIEIAAVDVDNRDDRANGSAVERLFWEYDGRFWLVGSEGVTLDARFVEQEMLCGLVCDEEGLSCRDTGLMDWQGEEIGEPLLVVAGLSGEVTDYVSFLDIEATEEIPELNGGPFPLLLPAEVTMRMTTEADGVRLGFQHLDDVGELELHRCSSWTEYGESGLGSLRCQLESVLFAGGEPLLLSSFWDRPATAKVVNGFSVEGQRYYTTVLELKGYTAYGLLFETKEGWQVKLQTPDWPLPC